MLNIAICDDDIPMTGRIEMLIEEIGKKNFINTDIEVFWNGECLADAIVEGECYDIIFLDIEMDREDGISVAKRIRKIDKNCDLLEYLSQRVVISEVFCDGVG